MGSPLLPGWCMLTLTADRPQRLPTVLVCGLKTVNMVVNTDGSLVRSMVRLEGSEMQVSGMALAVLGV